jgi:small conductance mechanosensitive channel
MQINYTAIGAVLTAFVLAAALVKTAQIVIHRFIGTLEIESPDNREAVQSRARQLIRALTLLAYGVAVLASVSLALDRLGVSESQWNGRQIIRWFLTHGINVLIVIVGSFIMVRLANLSIEHLQFKLGRRHGKTDLEWQRRATTVSGLLMRLVTATVGFIALLMVLHELTIDIVPILTGAGIVGLAIGFGAQNLVRDVISGFFLILEDQVRVGDIARINGIAGSVEHVNLRTIVLRDGEGGVQVFPNGTITSLANLSKQFAYAIVDVRVSYQENFDRVMGTAREVGATMAADPVWSLVLQSPLEVLGIESLADGAATLRVRFKTLPLNQGRVANELRRRLLMAFVGRGIRPYAAS